MHTGTGLSLIGHGIVFYLILFGGFDRPSPSQSDFNVSNVAIISETEFLELGNETDSLEQEVPTPLVATPKPEENKVPEDAPDQDSLAEPEPEVELKDIAQEVEEPLPPIENNEILLEEQAALEDPQIPDDQESVSISEVETQSEEPARQSAERIADEAAPEPEENVKEDVMVQEAVTPEPGSIVEKETVVEAAPPKTATETVTEADQTESTELNFSKPIRRSHSHNPVANENVVANQEIELTENDELESETASHQPEKLDVASLIQQAEQTIADSNNSDALTNELSAQLTTSEREGLKQTIKRCWNLSTSSDAAKRVVITIQVELETSGKPVTGSIKLVHATEAGEIPKLIAFEAAQRAIVRCLSNGYDLPVDKYKNWRFVEIVFDPEEMRNR